MPIPNNIVCELKKEPSICARIDEGDCEGRITWEHAASYGGRKIQERWAIIKLCERHHSLGRWQNQPLNKRRNREIAMGRATAEDRKRYPKLNWNEFKK